MTTIGMDLSLSNTGIIIHKGIHESFGTSIKTSPNPNRMERLQKFWKMFRKEIDPLINNYDRDSILFAIEDYAYGIRNSRAIVNLAEQGGLVRYYFHKKKIPLTVYAPQEIKKFATGKGNTPKDLMLKAVYKKWFFDTSDNNLADAYACARLRYAQWEIESGNKTIEDFLEYEKQVLKNHIK
jgi:crossover junction endodeoxyribonuclease RuvC